MNFYDKRNAFSLLQKEAVLVAFRITGLREFALFYRRNPAVIKFQFPRVSPGDQPLAKEPEDSGYEIGR